MELIIKKCDKCGSIYEAIYEKEEASCCGEKLRVLKENTVDASFEKHIPTYEIKDGKVIARVNHVMEMDHYIEWISFVYDNSECRTYFKPTEEPIKEGKYVEGMKIYAYCNKHELWSTSVK